MTDEFKQALLELTGTYLDDKKLSELTGRSQRTIADRRREAGLLPSQSKFLGDGGRLWSLTGYNRYMAYRGTLEWRKEFDKMKKMRG